MPVHDWTRVIAGIFHDFHQTWAVKISNALNKDVLPEEYYAMLEQFADAPRPDVTTPNVKGRVKYTEEMEQEIYAHAADRVAIYHASGDRVVAYIEIVSPGNKHSDHEVRQFIEKLDEALLRGCHLLVIDILPPGKHDPRGMHAAFWEHRTGKAHGVSEEQPLGLSAYQVTRVGENAIVPRGWFQPVAVGEPLPDMPLFLTPDHYVNVPLESTYVAAWQRVPRRWRDVIEGAREQ